MAGYWNATNPAAPFIVYSYTPSYMNVICKAFIVAGIIPIAWVETNGVGTPNITPANYAVYNQAVVNTVAMGFSGYSEDIEIYTGTVTQFIAYLNQQATLLHSLNKLAMPAVTCNSGGGINLNQYLNVDYILSMFYHSTSLFEDPSADIYWQENFGLVSYYSTFGTPASPVILGILTPTVANTLPINYNPLSWQLSQFNRLLNTYGSQNLIGISLFDYDYMSAQDWNSWLTWSRWGTTETVVNNALANVFADDFSAGNLTKWSVASGSPAITTTNVIFGTYACNLPAGAIFIYRLRGCRSS